MHFVCASWSGIIICYTIISIEIVIAWNGVRGVQSVASAGQLIPLFVGLLGLFKNTLSAILEHSSLFKIVH
jgi:hypothetical protein